MVIFNAFCRVMGATARPILTAEVLINPPTTKVPLLSMLEVTTPAVMFNTPSTLIAFPFLPNVIEFAKLPPILKSAALLLSTAVVFMMFA